MTIHVKVEFAGAHHEPLVCKLDEKFLQALAGLGLSLNTIDFTLNRILHELHKHRERRVHFNFDVAVSQKRKAVDMPLEVKLTTEQRVKVSVKPVTQSGSPAKVDGPVTFTCDTAGVVEFIDDNSAFLNAPESIGDFTVIVSADADLTGEVQNIQDTIILHVGDPQASSLGISVGDPELKPKA